MDKEKIFRERLKVLEKLVKAGYDTDKKILDLKLEDLLQFTSFNRSELTVANAIKNALANKKIITFLSGNETNKEERKDKNYE